MIQNTLGNRNLQIGEVGLGCWQFGGDFGPMDKTTAMAIMHEAVENGITFFDTADIYGNGRSESLIGEFIKETSAKVYVATKFGRAANVYPNHYTEDNLRTGIEGSLKRLGVETLDLVQLHCIPNSVVRDGAIFEWLRALQKQGKIRYFGASVETMAEARECMHQPDLVSLQIIFNIFRQTPIQEIFTQAVDQGVGIIVRLPLASGLLSGKFTRDTTFAESDHRNYNRDGQYFSVGETFAGLTFYKGLELTEQLKAWVPEGMTMAQMAIRWTLDFEAVSVVIPGASSPQQARDNARTSEMESLSADLHDQLHTFYQDQVHDHIRGVY
jgi:aryl-alcohol dehydrogenase-like predicted oxidoreductase